MSEFLTTAETIELRIRRCCQCGNFWAVERRAGDRCKCPSCAQNSINIHVARAEQAERSMRSLRGAMTRAKKRRRS